jgi:hypothetical protein
MVQGTVAGGAEFSGEVMNGATKPPQEEIDEAYKQLAKITGEPVDAVTPYGLEAEGLGQNPEAVVDPVAVRVIRVKEERIARAPLIIRASRRVRNETVHQVRSEVRDFHKGMSRTKKVAKRLGQSVTAAAREYRERGTWRRGRAPSREHVVRRLPKEALATQS